MNEIWKSNRIEKSEKIRVTEEKQWDSLTTGTVIGKPEEQEGKSGV